MALDVVFESEQAGTDAQPDPQPQPRVSSHGHASGSDEAAEQGMAKAAEAFVQSRETVSNATTESLQARLAELTKAGSPYMNLYPRNDADHAAHKAAVDEVRKIHEQLTAAQDPARQEQNDALASEDRAPDWDRGAEQSFRAFADEAGLPATMVNETIKAVSDAGVGMNFETIEEATAAGSAKWGAADFQTRVTQANLALDHLGPEVREQIERLGLGSNLKLVEILSEHGARISDALGKIEALKADPAYLNTGSSEHRLAVAEMARLRRIIDISERDLR
jgi:hypothetical protein